MVTVLLPDWSPALMSVSPPVVLFISDVSLDCLVLGLFDCWLVEGDL